MGVGTAVFVPSLPGPVLVGAVVAAPLLSPPTTMLMLFSASLSEGPLGVVLLSLLLSELSGPSSEIDSGSGSDPEEDEPFTVGSPRRRFWRARTDYFAVQLSICSLGSEEKGQV